MIGLAILLLLLLVIIGGLGFWVRQSRGEPPPEATALTPAERQHDRVPLLIEAVGYVGTILVLAGGAAAIGQRWQDIGTPGRLAVLGAATLVFLVVGFVIRSSTEPAFERLTSVTWAASVAAFAGTVAVVDQIGDTSSRTAFLTIATTSTVYAMGLWLLHQRAVQQAVLFAGILLSTASVISFTVHDPAPWMIAVPLWAIGLGWAAAGWWRRLTPWFVAVPLGLLVGLVAPAAIDQPIGVRFALGIGTAGVIMAFSVLVRVTPGLALASVALLGYVIRAVTFYFGDTLGVPASLSVAGLLILGLAGVAVHWHWFTGGTPGNPLVRRAALRHRA